MAEFTIDNGVLTKYKGTEADVVIPDGVVEIGQSVFRFRNNLVSITIPKGVNKIGALAFFGCKNLVSVTISDSTLLIGAYAFAYCASLNNITLKESTELEHGAFLRCTKLADKNGFVIFKGILFSYIGTEAEVVIPNGVSTIGAKAFKGNKRITNVIIPEGTREIQNDAFKDCENLNNISIPTSLIRKDSSAFDGCGPDLKVTTYSDSEIDRLIDIKKREYISEEGARFWETVGNKIEKLIEKRFCEFDREKMALWPKMTASQFGLIKEWGVEMDPQKETWAGGKLFEFMALLNESSFDVALYYYKRAIKCCEGCYWVKFKVYLEKAAEMGLDIAEVSARRASRITREGFNIVSSCVKKYSDSICAWPANATPYFFSYCDDDPKLRNLEKQLTKQCKMIERCDMSTIIAFISTSLSSSITERGILFTDTGVYFLKYFDFLETCTYHLLKMYNDGKRLHFTNFSRPTYVPRCDININALEKCLTEIREEVSYETCLFPPECAGIQSTRLFPLKFGKRTYQYKNASSINNKQNYDQVLLLAREEPKFSKKEYYYYLFCTHQISDELSYSDFLMDIKNASLRETAISNVESEEELSEIFRCCTENENRKMVNT